MSKKAKIDALIANEHTQFTEADAPWLNELEEAQIDLMAPLVDNDEEGLTDNSTMTMEAFIETAPAHLKGTVMSALNHRDEARKTMIANIMAHPANKYTEEMLTNKACTELTTLSEMLSAVAAPKAPATNGEAVPVLNQHTIVDYSGAAGAPAPNTNSGAVPLLGVPTINDFAAKP